jgi:hypothetical protein
MNAIAYRSIKQLFGDNYKLLNRQRQQKRSSSHERHKAQKKAASNQFGELELGQYLDGELAQAIIKLAQTYQAGRNNQQRRMSCSQSLIGYSFVKSP